MILYFVLGFSSDKMACFSFLFARVDFSHFLGSGLISALRPQTQLPRPKAHVVRLVDGLASLGPWVLGSALGLLGSGEKIP